MAGIMDTGCVTLEAPVEVVIVAGVIQIGQMINDIVPESGLVDTVTQVTLDAALLSTIATHYPLIVLKAADGYTITLQHGANIELAGGIDLELSGDITFFGYHNGTKLIDFNRAASGADLFSYLYFK